MTLRLDPCDIVAVRRMAKEQEISIGEALRRCVLAATRRPLEPPPG